MFVSECWYVAAWCTEIDQAPFAVSVAGIPLVLYRTSAGDIVSFTDRCPHRLAPLSLGTREGDDIRCMYHGLRFRRDGSCNHIPGQDNIPPTMRAQVRPTVERHGWIWVWMGAATNADERLIPKVIGPDDPQWRMGCSTLDYDANFALINHNLLDFSHLTYVHANSFKADTQWAENRPQVKRIERGVRVTRWIDASPALASALDLSGAPVETWQSYDFLVPGILVMRTYFCEVGTRVLFPEGHPRTGVLRVNATSQAVTPMTERTSRYFFAFGSRSSDTNQEDATRILDLGTRAFGEDKAIIEAQQRVIDASPGVHPQPTTADVAITQFDSIMRKLSKQAAA